MSKPLNKQERKGKVAAIVGYLTIFGSILALFLNSEENKTKFGSFHVRQGLGLNLVFILFGVILNGVFEYLSETQNLMVASAFYLAYFILWVYGFVAAVSGQQKRVPILGNLFQTTFKSLT
ncbi:hypothetical protein [Psychroflexus salis]|uniref:Import component protein n=1 Tax=Psychroflexus salis TaxID=1526574 RepID=A0A917E6P3_9FLAO|nr:hypothetical protein [Psychroflexus salis]GGE09881.1 hypothetical protein GCM10010831_09260 [Psychroflexus salis]